MWKIWQCKSLCSRYSQMSGCWFLVCFANYNCNKKFAAREWASYFQSTCETWASSNQTSSWSCRVFLQHSFLIIYCLLSTLLIHKHLFSLLSWASVSQFIACCPLLSSASLDLNLLCLLGPVHINILASSLSCMDYPKPVLNLWFPFFLLETGLQRSCCYSFFWVVRVFMIAQWHHNSLTNRGCRLHWNKCSTI